MKKLLVGVDGSMRSRGSLRWAKGLADGMGLGVRALTAFGPGSHMAFDTPDPADADGEGHVIDALDKLVADTGLTGVETSAVFGTASAALHEAAAQADVVGVVMGTRGLGTLRGLMLGSVSRRMLFDCAHPLFLLPDRRHETVPEVTRVLVAVDGSAVSASVAEWSARLCAALGAVATVVRCVDPGAELPPGHVDEYLVDVRSLIDERWCEPFRSRGIPYEVVAARGDARSRILEVADDRSAGLVVVAGRGQGQFEGLGGTTSYLVHHSDVPLAVVPCDPEWNPMEF